MAQAPRVPSGEVRRIAENRIGPRGGEMRGEPGSRQAAGAAGIGARSEPGLPRSAGGQAGFAAIRPGMPPRPSMPSAMPRPSYMAPRPRHPGWCNPSCPSSTPFKCPVQPAR
jgi:hypothetical protein